MNNNVQRGIQFKITNPSPQAVERSLFKTISYYLFFISV